VTFSFLDHAHGALHGRVVGDVELHDRAPSSYAAVSRLDAARPDVDGVPRSISWGSLASDVPVGAGDERHGHDLLSIVLAEPGPALRREAG